LRTFLQCFTFHLRAKSKIWAGHIAVTLGQIKDLECFAFDLRAKSEIWAGHIAVTLGQIRDLECFAFDLRAKSEIWAGHKQKTRRGSIQRVSAFLVFS